MKFHMEYINLPSTSWLPVENVFSPAFLPYQDILRENTSILQIMFLNGHTLYKITREEPASLHQYPCAQNVSHTTGSHRGSHFLEETS